MIEYYRRHIRYGKPGFGIAIPIWMPIGLIVIIALVVYVL